MNNSTAVTPVNNQHDGRRGRYNNWEQDWKRRLCEKNRPRHRRQPFHWDWLPGFISLGKKEDTIKWCLSELERINNEIEAAQDIAAGSPANSAFIQFKSQIAAHMACQSEICHLPEHMSPRLIGFCPEEIIWMNIALPFQEEWIRTVLTYAVIFIMISLWSIPVAWTGALSHIDQLIQHYEWFNSFLTSDVLKSSVSVIAGLLPTALLALLLHILPRLLELLATFKGAKTHSSRDEFVQTYYFVFLFIQLFLVVSIGSFFSTSIKELASNVHDVQRANDVLQILAQNLPKASNYFFSYMVLQSLSTSSTTLLQTGSLMEHYVIAPIIDRTPRDKWARRTQPRAVRWGSILPVYTNLACIALTYCIISPLICLFAIFMFGLLWLVQRYMMLFVYEAEYDTGGILYPRALNQTFTGVYVMELCLIGLFVLIRDEEGRATCSVHSIIMVFVLVGTILFQIFLNWRFGPLLRYLPVNLGTTDVETMHQEGRSEDLSMIRTTREMHAIQSPTTLQKASTNEEEAFDHIALSLDQPVVWIPKDSLGVSTDEIEQSKQFGSSIFMSSSGASLDSRNRVTYDSDPPRPSSNAAAGL
jgi:hypothetical protein